MAMPSMHIHRLGVHDTPIEEFQEDAAKLGVFLHDKSCDWNIVLIENGMDSGAPSILVWIPTDKGVIIIETSLEAWRSATVALASMAETHFGYTGRI